MMVVKKKIITYINYIVFVAFSLLGLLMTSNILLDDSQIEFSVIGVNLLISIGIVIFSFVFIKIISILFHPKQSMDRQVLSSQNRIENFTEIIYVLILLLVAFGLRAYYLFVQEIGRAHV